MDSALNAEGVCSDCHAGENPFVVHPDDPAFLAAHELRDSFFPDTGVWPTPIVPAAFVGNPEPIGTLGPSDSASRCDSCHFEAGPGGRLPLISTAFPRYCAEVLRPSVGEQPSIPVPNTMPQFDPTDIDLYADHSEWLINACDAAPGDGPTIPFTPPTNLILPPPLVEPPFTCSKYVTVKSAQRDATVKLYVDDELKGTKTYRELGGERFVLSDPLIEGQHIEATQTVGANTSTRGEAHVQDYPGFPLPPPDLVVLPIYECARRVAVSNIPGATVTVRRTEEDSGVVTFGNVTSGYKLNQVELGWQQGAFAIGDRFEAKQKLCPGDDSAYSASVFAEEAPDPPMPMVTFEQPRVGQQYITLDSIVQGARVVLKEQPSMVVVDRPSVPFHHLRGIDLLATPLGPIVNSDQLVATQELCGVTSQTPSPPSIPSCPATSTVPKIARPLHGDDFVLVLKSVPGATVRVFGFAPATTEIGNGIGDVIALTRTLVGGETIAVTESWGCPVNRAFSIVVAPP